MITNQHYRKNAASGKVATAKKALDNSIVRESHFNRSVIFESVKATGAVVISCIFMYMILDALFQTATGDRATDSGQEILKVVGAGFTALAVKYILESKNRWLGACYFIFLALLTYSALQGLIGRFVSDMPTDSVSLGDVGSEQQLSSWLMLIIKWGLALAAAGVVYAAENSIWGFLDKASNARNQALKYREIQGEAKAILELATASDKVFDQYLSIVEEAKALDKKAFLSAEVATMVENKVIDLASRRRSSPDSRRVSQSDLDAHYVEQDELISEIQKYETEKQNIANVVDLYVNQRPQSQV